ncbi:ATP-binding cassette domain-containing protein [Virgibacillus kimchii]
MYSVENLSFSYKKANYDVLKDISFDLKKDKVNAIVGVNGAGKTTLFDCITGILPAKKGIINIPPTKEVLYQTQSLFFSPAIKTKDFVNFLRRLDSKPGIKNSDEFGEIYTGKDFIRIQDLWNVKLGTMSVGERKWVFMVMLSGLERSLYLFDEPMSGVDPSSRLRMTKRIKELIYERGKICVISTHQLHDLSSMDCHIIILHNGMIKYEGDFKDWLKESGTDNPDQAFDLICGSG